MKDERQQKWICGFWRRLGAFFIDLSLLGLVGFLLGTMFANTFVQLADWGRLIGFFILLTYFGVMNSERCHGQTVGKKLLKIKVVDASNSSISLAKSLLRYSFIAIPFSLNGLQVTNELLLSYIKYPLSLILIGGFFSLGYLFVFNRNTRQSVHDLLTGTFVVNLVAEPHKTAAVWKPHFVVVIAILAAAALLPATAPDIESSPSYRGLLEAQQAVSSHVSVRYATVTEGSLIVSHSGEGSKTTSYVNVQALLGNNTVNDESFAQNLATTIIASYPEALEKDLINVSLSYGYSIVIWSSWRTFNYSFTPEQLKPQESA
ncbi:RDD family protein [Photobacterium gaetbulicola]|uniref:RDD domain-containing protein n=1 Tax=Photobacterium gaetbulicola Gung47 TaxID=658445 RepID=A0A0C5WJV5_9GAMM|nr:RDD family protein [Photobacterium gaetbulicola]AJR05389.1 hypothetical protein H744_1c0364 [Photobacterium gaetbulicola Gung47]PSU12711.1 RDD family protein [Photobacterium gaetbulicola]